MQTIPEFVLRNAREFQVSYEPSAATGAVFCATRKKLAIGAHVLVKVRLGRRQPPMLIFGRVAWRRPGRHLDKVRAGVGVELLPAERAKADYLLRLARGDTEVRSRRRHERFPVDLPVLWHPEGTGGGVGGRLGDIGRGGAFVRSDEPVTTESQVVLEIAPPGAEVPMAFSARVAWIGQRAGSRGFGVEWRARDAGGTRRIKELVRRLSGLPPPLAA